MTTETETLKTSPIPHAEIAARAYLLWERDGRPPGRDLEFWLQAEADLRLFRLLESQERPTQRRTTNTPSANGAAAKIAPTPRPAVSNPAPAGKKPASKAAKRS